MRCLREVLGAFRGIREEESPLVASGEEKRLPYMVTGKTSIRRL